MLNFLLACASSSSSSGGCYDWPVIKQIITFFGWIIEALYNFFGLFGIANIGLCIIVFTLLVKCCLLPLTIRQQKFTKLSAIMQPEITEIQNKYKGKTDNYSAQMMQTEIKAVYKKYGVSQTGGCLQSVIQLPIIVALFGALRKIPTSMENMRTPFEEIVDILDEAAYADVLTDAGVTLSGTVDDQISTLYTVKTSIWEEIIEGVSSIDAAAGQTIADNYATITSLNSFLGLDISQSPWNIMLQGGWGIFVVLVPLIAGAAQWLSMKLSQTSQSARSNDQAAMTNKSMAITMPIISIIFCFTLNLGLGLYWVTSSVFQVVLQILINRHYRRIDMDAFVKKNLEKAERKAEKKLKRDGVTGEGIKDAANANTKNIPEKPKSISEIANMDVRKSQSNSTAPPPNSLAAKAAMVSDLDDSSNKDNNGKKEKRKYKK